MLLRNNLKANQCTFKPATPLRPTLLHTDALSSIPRAITGLIYQERSIIAARKFVQAFFLSRETDLRSMIKFANPKKVLLETVWKFKRERPKSRCVLRPLSCVYISFNMLLIYRLLKETGRFSNSPVFVVGIFSGADQLGEGFGSSLRMAEFRVSRVSVWPYPIVTTHSFCI